jgi:branched-chain amino acid transport system substrate-binding protein
LFLKAQVVDPLERRLSMSGRSKHGTLFQWQTVLLLFCLFVVGCNNHRNDGKQKVVFGAILPMTGSAAQYGEEANQGIQIGIEHLRASRPDSKYSFAYELQDSESNPKNSEGALRVLRVRSDISTVVSEVSGVVLALAPICEREKIVLMNIGAQNPQIAGAGQFTFSNVNLADVESKQVAEFAFNVLNKKRAAVLYAAASYGQGARDVFVRSFSAVGGSILAETSYPADGTDYRAQIAEISRAKPEVVYLPGTTQDMARVLRQSYELGFRPQWLSYTAFEGQEILSLAGKAAEGVIFASAYLDWEHAQGLQAQFRDAYQAKYQKIPSVYAATSFDAILMLADAVEARGPSGEAVRDFLATMPRFEGASGLTQFDKNGTVNKPLVFKTVKNGAFVNLNQ